MKTLSSKKFAEEGAKVLFAATAGLSVFCVVIICFFLFANGIPTLSKIGPLNFLLGERWNPDSDVYGILPLILGSIHVTAGALLIGAPIGILTAVFLANFCPKKLQKPLTATVNLMAGIPSIVYGFVAMIVLVPVVHMTAGGTGKSMLTASILLGVMILPTVISVSLSSINTQLKGDTQYFEGALALGATPERATFFAVLPAAKSGIVASVILGLGRAIGETMAVVMVAGNQAIMPSSVTKGVRTMTSNIVLEMAEAADLHRDALIATGMVLFVFILLLNLCLGLLNSRKAVN